MRKETLLRAAEQLPEEFRIDELIERMIIIQKVDEAQLSLDAGKGIPHAEATQYLRSLLKRKRDGGDNMVA